MDEIVRKVEDSLQVCFLHGEVECLRKYTERKLEVIGEDSDYFPLLFETELRDYIMRSHYTGCSGERMEVYA